MDFDVIVVGSGFGGAVSAARLASKGMRVLVLERGPWWGPLNRDRPRTDRREFPRGLLGAWKLLRNVRRTRSGRRSERLVNADGLLELHLFRHLKVLTSSAVGGGSHIYTGILEEPPPELFDAFPAEITAGEMQPYFVRVREMLQPAPIPAPPPKNQVFEAAVAAAGLPAVEYPDLAVVWGQDPGRAETVTNAAGVEQKTSTWRGDCFVGCEDGSKTTLDLTYIPVALRHGAELRPLCEVTALGATPDGYMIRYRDHRNGRNYNAEAPRVVLAAGGLNTQRLLFAARDRDGLLPHLSARLGQRFSPNGDTATLLWRTRMLEDSSWGTSFNAFTRIQADGAHRFVLGEVGIPAQSLPAPGPLRDWLRRSTFLFCMGRDAATGVMEFDGSGLTTRVGRSLDTELFDEMRDAATRVSRYYRAKRILHEFLSGRGAEGLFSVHPLGGCAMASNAAEGVTDHTGQVFGHPGLYVADGSLYPAAPGGPPSLLIAALAERQAELME